MWVSMGAERGPPPSCHVSRDAGEGLVGVPDAPLDASSPAVDLTLPSATGPRAD